MVLLKINVICFRFTTWFIFGSVCSLAPTCNAMYVGTREGVNSPTRNLAPSIKRGARNKTSGWAWLVEADAMSETRLRREMRQGAKYQKLVFKGKITLIIFWKGDHGSKSEISSVEVEGRFRVSF